MLTEKTKLLIENEQVCSIKDKILEWRTLLMTVCIPLVCLPLVVMSDTKVN